MRSPLELDTFIPTDWVKFVYQTLQDGMAAGGLAHKTLATQLTDWVMPKETKKPQSLSPELMTKLQGLRNDLLAEDWQDAEAGVYPASLLFDQEWQDFLRYYPLVWLNMPDIWQRKAEGKYQAFSEEIDLEGYPPYYLQNFHYQTDGYLSDMSANLYDLQVEILFNGAADAMRRRILKLVKEGLSYFADVPDQALKILDIACGTGRSLKMLRATFPKASLFGVDLSPAYLRKANQLLSQSGDELPQLIQANAEALPYLSNYFQGITSVFLFHELPPKARQNVIEEAFRVLKPGGVFVICDSIQAIDSPEFQPIMENFRTLFHEPYFRHYINDDLVKRLEIAGFEQIKITQHLVSKYWVAFKPV
ncbi:MAG: class I SAM-dependent methyltransferase [Snowella sp.]|nr:class I SAM-dependent methyltransferase [Snowella sp.]